VPARATRSLDNSTRPTARGAWAPSRWSLATRSSRSLDGSSVSSTAWCMGSLQEVLVPLALPPVGSPPPTAYSPRAARGCVTAPRLLGLVSAVHRLPNGVLVPTRTTVVLHASTHPLDAVHGLPMVAFWPLDGRGLSPTRRVRQSVVHGLPGGLSCLLEPRSFSTTPPVLPRWCMGFQWWCMGSQ
jgi:hypothetical protein